MHGFSSKYVTRKTKGRIYESLKYSINNKNFLFTAGVYAGGWIVTIKDGVRCRSLWLSAVVHKFGYVLSFRTQ